MYTAAKHVVQLLDLLWCISVPRGLTV